MFSVTQPDVLTNKNKSLVLSCNIVKEENDDSVEFLWAPFPIEMCGDVSMIVPSPSGSKLLVIRNGASEGGGSCCFEIWSSSCLEKEFHIPQSMHGSVYNDGWFEGVSWNLDETLIAYVAEEPSPTKPVFNNMGYKKGGCAENDFVSWKGQGEWEEDWGEAYSAKRQPTLFVININSGEVQAVQGIDKSLSVGQVVWAPFTKNSEQYLVFVGWSSQTRKLGMKYCSNRPCALYAVRAPHHESKSEEPEISESPYSTEELHAMNLTPTISSALFPRFSPNGNFLVFLSAKSAVDSGVHNATNSLHRIDWPTDLKLYQSAKIYDIIPVVMCAEDGCFPGLYCTTIHSNPWLSDNCTMILSSIWHSCEVILSVNVLSGEVLRISPSDSNFSWNLLTLDGNNILAVSSNPVNVPQIIYGMVNEKAKRNAIWSWSKIFSPIFKCSDKVRSSLSSLRCSILNISAPEASYYPTKGAAKPFEAIFVSSKTKNKDVFDPLIVILHGGPQDVSLSHFSNTWAFLSSVGYSLLIVNYRGSLGFGEEALQSLPGKVGSQDVNDVLSAIDHVINLGLASPTKITVMGISHGGFLTTHLIGQAPEKFVAAAAINPVCNFALMVGTTDIPDWCYVEAFGSIARNSFTEAPSAEDLTLFYSKSPISHVSKVKAPTLFLLGAQDLRVPKFDGLQYARALKEKGVEVKIIMFQNDVHALKRPQSEWECILNIAVWFNKYCKKSSSMDNPNKEFPLGIDEETEQQYSLHSNLLQQFTSISSIDKSWIFNSSSDSSSQGMMFSVSQPNLLANKKRKFILSSTVNKRSDGSVSLDWAPFPVEMNGVSVMVPSPSGSRLLIVRNPEGDGGCRFEIWSNSSLEREFCVPQSKHGSVYADGWFEGISWNSDETHIAYVAEEPSPAKPTFNDQGYKVSGSDDKDSSSWKGQGDWEEDWGESYAGKRQPALFVINITSGEVQAVKGIDKSLSVGQVVWAPSSEGSAQYLVFVGWSYETRKLGIKYCYNRACALYAVKAPHESKPNENEIHSTEDAQALSLTQTISSAFLPRFSPDGNFLVFLSARSSVDSGAHSATNSLHRIDWPKDVKLYQSAKVHDVIPVVLCADDDGFPGLYFSSILSDPWLSDGHTLIIPSVWHSSQVLLSVNVLSGQIKRITPADSNFSWSLLTLHGNNIFAVSSSPIDVPQVKYGTFVEKEGGNSEWRWSDVSNPIYKCSDKVRSLLSSLTFSIMKISVKDTSENPTKGSCKPYESIFVSSKTKKSNTCDPLIVVLHGGPHSVSLSSFSKSQAFLSSLGYSLLIVNYRGSLGFGEEALQSLPGNVGSQDVNDVLSAIDHVIDLGLASPSKIAVLGGSHGGFLTTHLIGQAPEKFVAAAARNPVCNLALMVGTTDIPDWCFVESYGTKGRDRITEAPSAEDLTLFYSKSPIAHLSKVKTPTVFLLGAQDLRVPISTGLQYARALKEKGVPVKVILFPNDVHGIERPQSDFESFLSIAAWFNKYCK